jgi:ribosomal protein S18 acetylase RimI-like enzyme
VKGAATVTETITYRTTPDIDIFQLAKLFDQAGWQHRTRDLGRLARVVSGSMFVVSAWDAERLVGFARAISDGASDAQISTVAVHEDYRRKGIAKELIRRLLRGHDDLAFIVHAPSELSKFCAKAGFKPAPSMFRRSRKS